MPIIIIGKTYNFSILPSATHPSAPFDSLIFCQPISFSINSTFVPSCKIKISSSIFGSENTGSSLENIIPVDILYFFLLLDHNMDEKNIENKSEIKDRVK